MRSRTRPRSAKTTGSISFITAKSGGAGPAKTYPYAYVDRTETAPYWKLAQQYTLADDMFFTETASSFIAHQMLLSGTVRLNDKESLTDQPEVNPVGLRRAARTRRRRSSSPTVR